MDLILVMLSARLGSNKYQYFELISTRNRTLTLPHGELGALPTQPVQTTLQVELDQVAWSSELAGRVKPMT